MDSPVPGTSSSLAPSEVQPSFSPVATGEPPPASQRLSSLPPPSGPQPETGPGPRPSKTCGCGVRADVPALVYALGQLGYDLIREARCDSLAQKMAGLNGTAPHRSLALEPHEMLKHLEKNPWDAAAIEWILIQDGTPIYAIRPGGPFATQAYETLRAFLGEQESGDIERVSVPGTLTGRARLMNGQAVPVLVPDLRGMYSWTTASIVKTIVEEADGDGDEGRRDRERRRRSVHNFLERIYHGVRNLGVMPQERALNYAATNAFEAGVIFAEALRELMELDTINVVRSPICRPESDCWDVELYFFYPERQVQTVRKVYRFTVDVSDVVPVTVGPVRAWFTR